MEGAKKGQKRPRATGVDADDRKDEGEAGGSSQRFGGGRDLNAANSTVCGRAKKEAEAERREAAPSASSASPWGDFKCFELFRIPATKDESTGEGTAREEKAKNRTLPKMLLEYLPDRFPTITSAKKAVRKGLVIVDGAKQNTSFICRPGQQISLLERTRASRYLHRPAPEKLPTVKILYEDDDYAVVVKPAGVVTVGRSDSTTLQSTIPRILKPSSSTTSAVLRKPRVCHRLDKPTGGLVVCAKTTGAQERIMQAFRDRTIQKKYQAVVEGKLRDSGRVDKELDGKESITLYKPVRHYTQQDLQRLVGGGKPLASHLPDGATLVDMWPKTGRNHQLRRHMKHIGHPLVGDPRYGRTVIDPKFFYLWAIDLRNVPCGGGGGSKQSLGTRLERMNQTPNSSEEVADEKANPEKSASFSFAPPEFPSAQK